jgi:uncharacterized damage-inducible protein DinB
MHEDLIDRFERGGAMLSEAASGLNEEQLHARPGPGAWSIAELVVHMVDSDLVATDRMKRVIAEEGPTLLAYDQDAWIDRLGPHELPIVEELRLFALNRRRMARILRRCSPADFDRAGDHTERGRMTLADLVAGYVEHLDYHLKFLHAKRANLGVPLEPTA